MLRRKNYFHAAVTRNEELRMKNEAELAHDTPQIRITLWPAVLLALVHVACLAYTFIVANTLMQFMIASMLVPLGVLIGLVIWWMLCRKIPMKQRLAGVALVVLVLAWIILTHPIMSGGFSFLIVVFPILTLGTVGVLLATVSQPWPRRRAALVTLMLGAAVILTAVRVDGSNGDETPIMSWRWQPTMEELAEASLGSETQTNGTAVVSALAGPDDWPNFRGQDWDGRAVGVTFDSNWGDGGLKELWRRPIGGGWSSFTVIGDYFFTQEQRGEDELVVCYEADNGEQIWVNTSPGRFEESHGGGPRATPTFHEGKLYVLGALGRLQCLEATTGATVWERELTEDANAKVPTWGFSSSPLVLDDLVIVFAGGANGNGVVAYERDSGEPVWQAGEGTHSYSSVQLAKIGDVPQLLIPSNLGIEALAPKTGAGLWKYEWKMMADSPRCVQPLMTSPNVVLLGSDDQGTCQIEISQVDSEWEVEEQWRTRKFRPSFNDTVYHDGYAYGFDGRLLVCIDVETGERRWKSKRFGGQVLLLPEMNMLLVLSDKGDVVLVEAKSDAYEEVARLKALQGKTWNHPVIANGKLFARNSTEAVCYQLPGVNESATTAR